MDENEKMTVSISVRDIVEFILRSGDIDNRLAEGGMSDMTAMQDGARLHKKLQKEAGGDYRSEVALKLSRDVEYEGECFILTVEGRADGIFTDRDGVTCIDEIKTTLRNVKNMQEPVGVHRAQAMCYAYMYAEENGNDEMAVRMTYCNRESEQTAYFEECFDVRELREWFEKLTTEYSKWVAWEIGWRRKRNESILEAKFPFEYREGQKRLVSAVYKSIGSGKKLFIEAPTGVGKTMSTVFPAVWSMGEQKTEKIFYGTAKTIARTVAEEAFEILRKRGVKFRSVTITSKEKLCILETPECNPEACERAKGHFDRINDCVYDMLTHEEYIDREMINRYAQKYTVCPFEMCLDVTLWADGVICDYNYLFDPSVHLKRFFDGGKRKFCLLIDEAHNLVERAREMYSAELIKEDFLEAVRMIKAEPVMEKEKSEEAIRVQVSRRRVSAALESCNKALLSVKRECDSFQVWENCGGVAGAAERFCAVYEEVSKDLKLQGETATAVRDIYFAARHFVNMHDEMDDDYEVYSNYTSQRHFRFRLQCMDPSRMLKNYMMLSDSVVLFSATLLPIRYYMEQLAGAADDYSVYAPSPFDTSRRLLLVGKDVSTKYTRRSDSEYEKIAEYIVRFTNERQGNYLVYFPSYAVMEDVAQKAGDRLANLKLQGRNMSESEKEDFLAGFEEDPDSTHIGFCVMGGLFSEGIDLKNDRLIGVVIVGTGLPMVCDERELFRDYFERKKGMGFEYAYLYNGMNKVMQAAGRVIRTMEDTGAILLLDERFLNRQYLELFPREWSDYRVVTCDSVNKELELFWKIH